MKTGWIKDGGNNYYLGSNGDMQIGWIYDDNKWYHLSPSLEIYWEFIDGIWYYLRPIWGGAMALNNWEFIDGIWYYFYQNGAMAISTVTPDGFTVDDSGRWIG